MLRGANERMLCVDPSKPGNNTGVVWFVNGYLSKADLNTRSVAYSPYVPSVLLVEFPQYYHENQEEDPNDLLQVARCVGQWEEWAAAIDPPGCLVVRVHPREWKGQTPKKIHNARVLERLIPNELATIPKLPESKLHNVLDAIGLGLWALDRMSKACNPAMLAWTKGKL